MTRGEDAAPATAAEAFAPDMTIAAARRGMAALFARAGLPTPDLDARLLVAHALGLDRSEFLLSPDRRLGQAAGAVAAAACRRLAREPVARILGNWEFWGLTFDLAAATLIPRPDTETIVEAALAEVDAARRRQAPLSLLDLGTGSGAILVALLRELPRACGLGVDRAYQAACAARGNAIRNGVAERAAFVVGDWSTAVSCGFDLVVANPPYIRHDSLANLEPEILRHEPQLALDGGMDGLDAYRQIIAGLDRLLLPGGRAILEVGAGQAGAVLALLAGAGFGRGRVRCDLAGHERAVIVPAAGSEGCNRLHLMRKRENTWLSA